MISLTNGAGGEWSGTNMPQAGAYPTRLWVAGEYVADAHALQLPRGSYRAAVGLYAAETGTRLQLADGSDSVSLELAVP